MVTPGFILVYPTQENVTLYYGSTKSDMISRALSVMGLGLLGVMAFRSFQKRKKTHENKTPQIH